LDKVESIDCNHERGKKVPEASTFPAGMHLPVASAIPLAVGFEESVRWKPWPENSTNVVLVVTV
jgi:hypothetical protein